MMKKMYVVQSDNCEFWCGMNIWDKQLRKAKIFHSLKYAVECCERFKARTPKIVEVSLTIVPEMKTNADRIRAMSDAELAEIISENILTGACNDFDIPGENPCPHNCKKCVVQWLQQEAE